MSVIRFFLSSFSFFLSFSKVRPEIVSSFDRKGRREGEGHGQRAFNGFSLSFFYS